MASNSRSCPNCHDHATTLQTKWLDADLNVCPVDEIDVIGVYKIAYCPNCKWQETPNVTVQLQDVKPSSTDPIPNWPKEFNTAGAETRRTTLATEAEAISLAVLNRELQERKSLKTTASVATPSPNVHTLGPTIAGYDFEAYFNQAQSKESVRPVEVAYSQIPPDFSPLLKSVAAYHGVPAEVLSEPSADKNSDEFEHSMWNPDPAYQAPGHPPQIEVVPGALSTPSLAFHLIPRIALERLAERFMLGEERKGEGAWNAGSKNQHILKSKKFLLDRLNHVMHHTLKLMHKLNNNLPLTDDDDAAAIAWGGVFAIAATDAMNKEPDDSSR